MKTTMVFVIGIALVALLLMSCASEPVPEPLSLKKGGIVCNHITPARRTFQMTSIRIDNDCMVSNQQLVILRFNKAIDYHVNGLVHIVTENGNGVTHISQLLNYN